MIVGSSTSWELHACPAIWLATAGCQCRCAVPSASQQAGSGKHAGVPPLTLCGACGASVLAGDGAAARQALHAGNGVLEACSTVALLLLAQSTPKSAHAA